MRDFSFNLVEEPWAPCIRHDDGALIELGLRDALVQAHTLRQVHAEPSIVTAGLLRLMLAVLHRVFGPDGDEGWQRLWQAGRWDAAALDAYFERWRHRFDIFDDDRPFAQVSTPPRGKPRPGNALRFEGAKGVTATLFDHTTDADVIELSPALAARRLLAYLAFHPAGLSGGGQPNYTDSPWSRGAIFVVEGHNLFETLALNLLPPQYRLPAAGDDRPAWEQEDPFRQRASPGGHLDYLTWPSRRMRLIPELSYDGRVVVSRFYVSPGLRLDPETRVSDPMKCYRVRRKKRSFVYVAPERPLWRDVAAIFGLSGSSRPPAPISLAVAQHRAGALGGVRGIAAFGQACQQAKPYYFLRRHLPLPLHALSEPDLAAALQGALEVADAVGAALSKARWASLPSTLSPGARFWAAAEEPLRELMDGLEQGDGNPGGWQERLLDAALAQIRAGERDAVREALEGVLSKLRKEEDGQA
jgi:CRISPR system Cascade subunit CasA